MSAKEGLAILIGKMKTKPKQEEPKSSISDLLAGHKSQLADEESTDAEDKKVAAESLLKAIDDADPEAIVSAFESMMVLCKECNDSCEE